MQRIAEIERQTLQEAREMLASTEHDSQDALQRSSRLVERLEVLTDSVGQMTERLQAEYEDVARSLRGLREARVALPEDLVPDAWRTDRPEPEIAASEIEPSPELVHLFRERITSMRREGRPREEAERALLRFRLGHHFLDLLDEIYATDLPAGRTRKGGVFARFRRA